MDKIKINFNMPQKEKSLNNANITYNFDCKFGELEKGMGIQSFKVCYDGVNEKTFVVDSNIQKILKCFFYDYYDTSSNQTYGLFLFYVQKTNDSFAFYYAFFETLFNELREVNNLTFSKEPLAIKLYVNEKSYMLFVPTTLNDTAILWTNTSSATYGNVPISIDACFYDGKLYAIPKDNPHRIFVTSNQSPETLITSQFNGDYLDFQDGLGNFVALRLLNGALYAIREYGITKISSTNCGENFSYKTITHNFLNIQKNTICVCNDKIFMLFQDGLYAFDGMDFEKKILGIEEQITSDNTKACADFINGIYYLALKLNDVSAESEMPCLGMNNNSIISLNEDGKIMILRGVSSKHICAFGYKNNQKVLICFDDENAKNLGEICYNGKIFINATPKLWETQNVHFSNGENVIKSLSLSGNGTFQIKIFVDEKTFVYNVLLSKINKKINVCQKGRKFGFCFKSSSQDAQICDAVLEVL